MGSCGDCACYSDKKKTCAMDGLHKTKANGCGKHVPRD